MRAIILLGHGSRVPGAGKDMERAVELLKSKYNHEMVVSCNMSRLGPHFPETLEKCISEGAKEIIVIPYFLNMGVHIRLDIPEMMQKEAAKYSDIKLIYGKQLGFDDVFADILHKRIEQSASLSDVRELNLEPRESFPVPEGQGEFVEMDPDEAKKYSENSVHSHSHSHGH